MNGGGNEVPDVTGHVRHQGETVGKGRVALAMVGRRQTPLLWYSVDPSSTVGQTDNPPRRWTLVSLHTK